MDVSIQIYGELLKKCHFTKYYTLIWNKSWKIFNKYQY